MSSESVPRAPRQSVYDMFCSDRRVAVAAGMSATGTLMAAMHEERVYVTERQKQQLKRTTGSLRQLNRIVLRELRRIGRPNQTTKRYSDAGVLLETAASQIYSLLRFREEILASARDESRVLFVTISVVGRSHNEIPEDLAVVAREQVPPVDPAHYLELETLWECVFRMGERVCSRSIRSKNFPDGFVVGLRRVTAVLVKQQRHLRETAPTPSAIRTVIRDYTGVSQKRAKISNLEERREQLSPVESRSTQNEI